MPLNRLSYGRVVCIVTFTRSTRTGIVRMQPHMDLFWGNFEDVGEDGKQRFAFKIDDVRKIPFENRPLITGRQTI